MLGNCIVRSIVQSNQLLPVFRSLLMAHKMSQDKSKSLGLRYVDHDLVPQEGFIGLYEVPGTSGVEIAKNG